MNQLPTPEPPHVPGSRRNLTLFLTLPPPERQRLEMFAKSVGRPLSWVVRDACRLYMDAAEADADAMSRLRSAAPALDMKDAGKTPQDKRGRPKKLPEGYKAAPTGYVEGGPPV